jgi:AGZA family xanthine/uracil permease-like MFS transporter
MLLSAATVAIIERRFVGAALWTWSAAALSVTGLIHSYRFTQGDTALDLAPAWSWATGYAAMGTCFLLARWLTKPRPG